METLKITATDEHLTIKISPSMKPIIKFGLVFQGLLYAFTLIGLIFMFFKTIDDMGFVTFGFFALAVICFIIGRKYLSRVFYKESVVTTKTELIIIENSLFEKKIHKYLIDEISNISFIGQNEFTPNLITGSEIYSNGLRIGENEIQYLIEDGTIGFFHNGITKRFAKNIASWDAEEIISRIESFTGKKFNVRAKKEKFEEDLDCKNIRIDYNLPTKLFYHLIHAFMHLKRDKFLASERTNL
jgi:hypothetical protein